MIMALTDSRSSRTSYAMQFLARATATVAILILCACSNEPQQLMSPSRVPNTFRSATIGSGHGGGVTIAGGLTVGGFIGICVSSDSPAGNYTFAVEAYSFPSGGLSFFAVAEDIVETVPTLPNTVSAGDCTIPAFRNGPVYDFYFGGEDPFSFVTYHYVSNDVAGGASFSGVVCHDDAGNPHPSVCPLLGAASPTVTGAFNFLVGTYATFSFVQTPADMIAALRVTLANMELRKGTGHSLDDKLREIQKALDKGETSHACKELDHFIKEVSEHDSKKVGSDNGAILVAKANAIKVALGCEA